MKLTIKLNMKWKVKNSNIDPVGYSPKEYRAKTLSPLLSEIRQNGLELI